MFNLNMNLNKVTPLCIDSIYVNHSTNCEPSGIPNASNHVVKELHGS